MPGSETLRVYEALIEQSAVFAARNVTNPVFVSTLDERLDGYTQDRGLVDPEVVLGDVDVCGAAVPVPDILKQRVWRALEGPLGDLTARGLITSCEMLASLVPGLAAEAASIGFTDPVLRRLMYALRVAFRARRSLLLLNLQHQVTIDELPWVAAIQRRSYAYAIQGDAAKSCARDTLAVVIKEALCNFPQTVIPNVLLKSCYDLAVAAGVGPTLLPIVDELAADIFMGRFSQKFLAAARCANGTFDERNLYVCYYGLQDAYERLANEDATLDTFGELCHDLAGVARSYWGSTVAANGKVIEQQQLLTTQNLAVFVALDAQLGLELRLDWASLATKTWTWIVTALSSVPAEHLPRLRLRKDVAYAWRQLVYYTSRLPLAEQSAVLATLACTATSECAHRHCLVTFLFPLVQAAGRLDPVLSPRLGWTTDSNDDFLPKP